LLRAHAALTPSQKEGRADQPCNTSPALPALLQLREMPEVSSAFISTHTWTQPGTAQQLPKTQVYQHTADGAEQDATLLERAREWN